MSCSGCGKPIFDKDNFCKHCGKPQKPNLFPYKKKYETCEIIGKRVKIHPLEKDKLIFQAKAAGEYEYYCAAESDLFTGYGRDGTSRDSQEINDAHARLVDKLIKDGWELIESRGGNWYSFMFRRKIKRPVPKEKCHYVP